MAALSDTNRRSDSRARVAIGVPTFGRCRYLAQTIDSVIAQTSPTWTLTICDDGGGDACEVAGRYLGDDRISYVANESRLGAAGNWSKVVQSADAEIVAVLSQDDYWGPGYLDRRLAFLDSHPECGFVFGPHVDVDEHGVEIRRAPKSFGEGVLRPTDFVPRLLRDVDVRPSPPSILVRRSAYAQVGPRFDDRFVVFDLEMWLRIALELPVGYVPSWDSFYRVHPDQLSKRVPWGLSWLEFERHAEDLVAARLPQVGLSPRERSSRRSAAYLSAAMDALAHDSRRDVLRLLRAAIRERPSGIADVRLLITLALVPFGRSGGEALRRVRWWAARRGAHLPFHSRH
jgi:glycosyltransferase involved in cell wall biosynthesis